MLKHQKNLIAISIIAATVALSGCVVVPRPGDPGWNHYYYDRGIAMYGRLPAWYIMDNPELHKVFKELYVKGISNQEIANTLNIGTDSVNRLANELNIKKKRIKLTDKERIEYHKQIIEEYENTKISIKELSEKYKLVSEAIRKILKNTRRYQDEVINKKDSLYKKLYVDWKEGIDYSSIAKQYGISKSIIDHYVRLFKLDQNYIERLLTEKADMRIDTFFRDEPQFKRVVAFVSTLRYIDVQEEEVLGQNSGYRAIIKVQ